MQYERSPSICIKCFKVQFTVRALFCLLFTRLSAFYIVDFVIQILNHQLASGSARPLANRRFSFPALSVRCTVCNAQWAMLYITSNHCFSSILSLCCSCCLRATGESPTSAPLIGSSAARWRPQCPVYTVYTSYGIFSTVCEYYEYFANVN